MNNKNPSISVVMPVYNMELYVEEAIKSILCQTFSDFEFIIIDDGSVDGTWEIVRLYQEQDRRIVAVRNECNLGNYPSRNRGIKKAKGKYIAVMDSDDIAMPERFEKQFLYLEENSDIVALGTNYALNSIDNKKNVPFTYEDIRISLLRDFNILHPSLMIRREDIISLNGYDEHYKCAADYNLLCQLLLLGKVENLSDVLMIYRIHEGQISQSKKIEQDGFARSIRKKYQVDFINKYRSENQDSICIEEVGFPEIGFAICCFTYANHLNENRYRELADKTIDVVYKITTKDMPLYIEGGLCGLGCGFQYLIKNKFLDGDVDEVLEDIDNKVIATLIDGSNKEYIKDLLFYMNYRISKSNNLNSRQIQYLSSLYDGFAKRYDIQVI